MLPPFCGRICLEWWLWSSLFEPAMAAINLAIALFLRCLLCHDGSGIVGEIFRHAKGSNLDLQQNCVPNKIAEENNV